MSSPSCQHCRRFVSTVDLNSKVIAGPMGYKPVPSAANFILFSGFKDDASDVWQRLLDRGILIRDIGLRGYLRVTIGTPAENDQFIAALREIAE